MPDLLIRLPEVFTNGPEGTESAACKNQHTAANGSVLTSVSGPAQESWASDLNRVREFLLGYMRGGAQPEPMLQLDEVNHKNPQ